MQNSKYTLWKIYQRTNLKKKSVEFHYKEEIRKASVKRFSNTKLWMLKTKYEKVAMKIDVFIFSICIFSFFRSFSLSLSHYFAFLFELMFISFRFFFLAFGFVSDVLRCLCVFFSSQILSFTSIHGTLSLFYIHTIYWCALET